MGTAQQLLICGGISGDAYFSFRVGLWHLDSLSGTFPNSAGAGVVLTPDHYTGGSDPTLDTSVLKFGAGSMLVNAGGAAITSLSVDANYQMGTGEFCFESWFRVTSATGYQCLFCNSANGGDTGIRVYTSFNGDGKLQMYAGAPTGATRIQGGTTVPLNAWNHMILARTSGVSYLGMNGSQEGSSYTDSNSYAGGMLFVGNVDKTNNYTQRVVGNIDETRVAKGSGGGYAGGSYTVPTIAYPNF